jgi:hypothetical protein
VIRHFGLSFHSQTCQKFFLLIQNPHGQTILTIKVLVFYAYPEPSNKCLKTQNNPRGALSLQKQAETALIIFCGFEKLLLGSG